jgi:RNA polymerase sigma factor (sigma-70 family)
VLHHDHRFIASEQAERRAAAQKRRPPADAGELERTMLAAARGEGAGWDALVGRFTSRVRAVARMHRLSPHDVDDVLQTTWLRLLEHIHSVREPAALGAWLETTARRESLRVLRDAKRERPTDDEEMPDALTEPVAERDLVLAEQRAALVASIGRLPTAQRRLLCLLLTDPAQSYAEISRSLDMPVGSIGPTRGRSLARLRRDRELVQAVGREE